LDFTSVPCPNGFFFNPRGASRRFLQRIFGQTIPQNRAEGVGTHPEEGTPTSPSNGASLDALGQLLDERYCRLLPKGSAQQHRDVVRRAMAKYELTDCYVLAEHGPYDQQQVGIEEALEQIVSAGHTSLIFFVPGKVAYLEGHSPGERYLCIREETAYSI
jgi:hypothetical protein